MRSVLPISCCASLPSRRFFALFLTRTRRVVRVRSQHTRPMYENHAPAEPTPDGQDHKAGQREHEPGGGNSAVHVTGMLLPRRQRKQDYRADHRSHVCRCSPPASGPPFDEQPVDEPRGRGRDSSDQAADQREPHGLSGRLLDRPRGTDDGQPGRKDEHADRRVREWRMQRVAREAAERYLPTARTIARPARTLAHVKRVSFPVGEFLTYAWWFSPSRMLHNR